MFNYQTDIFASNVKYSPFLVISIFFFFLGKFEVACQNRTAIRRYNVFISGCGVYNHLGSYLI